MGNQSADNRLLDPQRWEVKIGSAVVASDEEYGHLKGLLVDHRHKQVFAILVQPHGWLPSKTVVVPKESIIDAAEDEVRLRINREQVDLLPKFGLTGKKLTGIDTGQLGLRLHVSQSVFCRDGYAGRVSLILVDPGEG